MVSFVVRKDVGSFARVGGVGRRGNMCAWDKCLYSVFIAVIRGYLLGMTGIYSVMIYVFTYHIGLYL